MGDDDSIWINSVWKDSLIDDIEYKWTKKDTNKIINQWTKNELEDIWKYIKNDKYDQIKDTYIKPQPKKETKEEKVLRIIKGDFERKFGISIDEFYEEYQRIAEENPEKLI